jgi:hypothetical protein
MAFCAGNHIDRRSLSVSLPLSLSLSLVHSQGATMLHLYMDFYELAPMDGFAPMRLVDHGL